MTQKRTPNKRDSGIGQERSGENTKRKVVGRPKKPIDLELVEDLAGIMCTHEEIAQILKVSVSTLEHNEEFLQVYKRALNTAKSSLRRRQYQAAMDGSNALLIWLGKQYLGQTDKQEREITGKDGGPVVLSHLSDDEVIRRAREIIRGS